MSRLYRRLETCGKPFVVCIQGNCMGGATELALAAMAASWPTTRRRRIALPEVKIGIFPGAGGTQRVMRMADAQAGSGVPAEGLGRRREEGEGDEARRRGCAARQARRDRQGDDSRRIEADQALGPEGLEAGRGGEDLLAGRIPALAGGERALPQGDLRQLSGRALSAAVGIRRSAAPYGCGAEGREPLLRACAADEGGGGDDPLALRLHAGPEQGCAPAEGRAAAAGEEARRPRRRLHGRRVSPTSRRWPASRWCSSTATCRRPRRARRIRTGSAPRRSSAAR